MKNRARSLLVLAREDLALALESQTKHPRATAFHLQQAAEKMTKAVLDSEGIGYPFVHQIGVLVSLLPPDHEWRSNLLAFDAVTAFATVTRYPTADGELPPLPEPRTLSRISDELDHTLTLVETWCAERLAR